MQDTGNTTKENAFLKRQAQYLETENEKIKPLMDQARKDAAKIRDAEFEISSLRNEVKLKHQVDEQLAESRTKVSALTIEKHTLELDLAKWRAEANAHEDLRVRKAKVDAQLAHAQLELAKTEAVSMDRDRLKGKKAALTASLAQADESIRQLSVAERELRLAEQHIEKMDIEKAHLQEQLTQTQERLDKLHADNEILTQENGKMLQQETQIEDLEEKNKTMQKRLKVAAGRETQATSKMQDKDDEIRQLQKDKLKWKNLAEHPDLSKLPPGSSPPMPPTPLGSDVPGMMRGLGKDSHIYSGP